MGFLDGRAGLFTIFVACKVLRRPLCRISLCSRFESHRMCGRCRSTLAIRRSCGYVSRGVHTLEQQMTSYHLEEVQERFRASLFGWVLLPLIAEADGSSLDTQKVFHLRNESFTDGLLGVICLREEIGRVEDTFWVLRRVGYVNCCTDQMFGIFKASVKGADSIEFFAASDDALFRGCSVGGSHTEQTIPSSGEAYAS